MDNKTEHGTLKSFYNGHEADLVTIISASQQNNKIYTTDFNRNMPYKTAHKKHHVKKYSMEYNDEDDEKKKQ